jgi:hypothetical protein
MKVILMLSMAALLIGCSNLVKSGAIVEAQNALNNSNYAEALENTEIAESFGELSEADTAKLHYLRAQSLEGLGRQKEALMNYLYVVQQHGGSAYAGLSQQRFDTLNALSTN